MKTYAIQNPALLCLCHKNSSIMTQKHILQNELLLYSVCICMLFNILYYKNVISCERLRIQLCDIPLLNIHRDTAYDVSFVSTYKEEGGLEDGGGG